MSLFGELKRRNGFRVATAYAVAAWLLGPGAKAFRQTPLFKQYVKELGIETYWRKHGFLPVCRVLGGEGLNNGDYICD